MRAEQPRRRLLPQYPHALLRVEHELLGRRDAALVRALEPCDLLLKPAHELRPVYAVELGREHIVTKGREPPHGGGLARVDVTDGERRVSFDLGELKKRRDAYVARLNGIYQNNLGNSGVEFITGDAKFVGPKSVDVGGTTYTVRLVKPLGIKFEENKLGEPKGVVVAGVRLATAVSTKMTRMEGVAAA